MNAIAVSDQELVGQILAGRREAFSILVERHLHSALAIARARLLNPTDADDAVQEAFLRAYQSLPSLREPAKFGPWLLTIARHEAVRLVVKGRQTLGADPAAAPELAAADHEPAKHELHALLRDHIAKLPEQAREVLLLHYFAGRSSREIATLLDLRQGAVLKRLQRAREHLAESMLHELEAGRPSRDSLAKQIARIAALISAATIPAIAPSAIVAAATALFPKASIFAAGLIGALVTLAGIAAFIWQSQDRETYAQDSPPAASPQRVDAVKEAPALPSNEPASAQPPESIPSAAAADATQNESIAYDPNVNLSQPVSLTIENLHIAEAMATLEEQSGAHFLIDRRAVGAPAPRSPNDTVLAKPAVHYPVDGRLAEVDIQDHPLSAALDLIAREFGLRAVWEPGFVWISTPDRIRRDVHPEPRERFARYKNSDQSNTNVKIHMSNVHISEVLEFINTAYEGVNIVLDSRVVAPAKGPDEVPSFAGQKCTDGTVRYISVRNVALGDVLRVLGRLTNTKPEFRGDYVWFTSPDLARQEGVAAPIPSDRDGVGSVFTQPITIGFQDVQLPQILQFVREFYSINMALDQRVAIWRDEPTGAVPVAINGDPSPAERLSHGMLRWLDFKNASLKSVLDVITRDVDLTYEVRDDTIVISSLAAMAIDKPGPSDLIPAKEFAEMAKPFVRAARVKPAKAGSPALTAADGVTPAKEPHKPASAKAKPRLRNIQATSDGGCLAEIESIFGVGWYSEGKHFEEYKLVSLDAAAGTVTMINEKTNETFTLRRDQAAP